MNKFPDTAAEIANRGWTVLNDFLPPEALGALNAEARRLWRQDDFRRAGVGRGDGYALRADIRGDSIRWLDAQSPTPAQTVYWETIEELRQALNRELFLSLASFESHFAIYPPGAFYQKHVDRFNDPDASPAASGDERAISCTLYLNEAWGDEDGGQLRLYLPDNQVEVLPLAGVCVLFRSDTFFHEVLPARQTRFSLTGWFRRRSPRLV